jgi:mRNA-degrading endonuclease RelE of RelBE toxin-antitoxin system
MSEIALAHTFIESLAQLEPVATKRTAAFLDKLVREPGYRGFHSEMVHDAQDRNVRSLRVTDDLRAIARITSDTLLLLFVAHHDDAYLWAREHCASCSASQKAIDLLPVEFQPAEHPVSSPAAPVFATPSNSTAPDAAYGWFCTIEDGHELCRTLDDAGIAHGLAQ